MKYRVLVCLLSVLIVLTVVALVWKVDLKIHLISEIGSTPDIMRLKFDDKTVFTGNVADGNFFSCQEMEIKNVRIGFHTIIVESLDGKVIFRDDKLLVKPYLIISHFKDEMTGKDDFDVWTKFDKFLHD